MKKVLVFSGLLTLGLLGSQFLPAMAGDAYGPLEHIIRVLTMTGLSFIMIHVGFEFDIDKSNLRQYGWDYVVAMTAATFPWIMVALYFVFVMLPGDLWSKWDAWKETLLAARFAAPTSAGVLFAMLAAAGLSATWLYGKARVLAIFDDLDTVLLMIPLKVMMVGLVWQLGVIVGITAVLLWLGWAWLHRWRIPVSWPYVVGYSVVITLASEWIYFYSNNIDDTMGIHIEVLLPAFVLGMMIARSGDDPHVELGTESEKRAATAVSAAFMVLVGLSMPAILGAETLDLLEEPHRAPAELGFAQPHPGGEIEDEVVPPGGASDSVLAEQPFPGWGIIALHVLLVTVVSNVGKMFPLFCYRREAHWKTRLALSIGMFPRGEVGAGILVVSLSYGIGGPVLTVAMLSLSLNLLLTGVFIYFVRRLLASAPAEG